jgi:hypothetical protein
MHTDQITREDKLQLIIVAIHVVLRRDMSLNRRIYAWLSGASNTKQQQQQQQQSSKSENDKNKKPQQSPQTINNTKINSASFGQKSVTLDWQQMSELDYFSYYSKSLLIQAIKMLLNRRHLTPNNTILYLYDSTSFGTDSILMSGMNSISHGGGSISGGGVTSGGLSGKGTTSPNTDSILKILKIVANLVERAEIGQAIIEDILLDLLVFVYKECLSLMIFTGVNVVSSNNRNYNNNNNNLQPPSLHQRKYSFSSG